MPCPPFFLIFLPQAADVVVVNPAEDLEQQEIMLNRFHRLISDLLRGAFTRNTFQPWEIEILLDLERCAIPPNRREQVLRQYQKAVQKQMETGPGPPMKLSEYLQLKMTRRPSVA